MRLRVGVIGAGRMGMHHARVYSMLRGAELVGVADVDPGAAEAIALRYDARPFTDFRELLRLVDAVSIAVPTSAHYDVARTVLESGIHALVEKPLARDVREAEEIVRLAEAGHLVLQVGHIERFNPAVQELRRSLAREKVLAISSRRCSPPTPHMQDVDVVYDLLIHDLDIALSIAGAPPRQVNAMGNAIKGHQTDLALVHVEFENGVLADLVASKITQQRIRQIDVTTDRSYVTVDYLTRDISIYREATVSDETAGPVQHTQGVLIAKPVVRPVEPLQAELEHFLAVVGGGTPSVHPVDAIAALRLADRIEAQLAAGIATV